jgi:drug/metabolite transporter (DMT)-like permease
MPPMRRPGTARAARPGLRLVVALATVYVVWGSTYLAIAIGIETIPPFLLGGVRFLVAGAAMFTWSVRRGDRTGDRLGAPQWRAALVVGGLLLAVGNGGVSWAEQFVPSGLAALVIATVPLWIAVWARALLGERLRPRAIAGLLVGLGGVAVLVQPRGGAGGSTAGVLALLLSALAWSGGSVWSRRARLPSRPLVATSMEMLAGGGVLVAASALRGEWSGFSPAAVSGRSLAALAYLVCFGSIAAFTAYMWLLRTASTALTATYAYVNPIVAVLLGWAVLDEAVTPAMALGGGVIVLAVALIVTASSGRRGG